MRNIGANVAVGDWVVISSDGDGSTTAGRRSASAGRSRTRQGARAAANIDVAFLLHALTSPPNPRRLEARLVLAFDSGAQPAILLTKLDLVEAEELATVQRGGRGGRRRPAGAHGVEPSGAGIDALPPTGTGAHDRPARRQRCRQVDAGERAGRQ